MTLKYQGTADRRLDSRDLIAWLEEFEDDEEMQADEDAQEIAGAIRALADAGLEDWEYGAALIREDEFEDYAREIAEDIGAIGTETSQWPLYCIDWEYAARELSMDYTSVSFLGYDYWAR